MKSISESVVPDTYGLPEYFVTNVETEIIGNNVRIFCGVKRGSEIHWLYSVVMAGESLVIGAKKCADAAGVAFHALEATASDISGALIH